MWLCGYVVSYMVMWSILCPGLPMMTLSTFIILSPINFTLFVLKQSTSQNCNPEIFVRLHYLFVELTTIVKLIIPMKVNIDTPICSRDITQ